MPFRHLWTLLPACLALALVALAPPPAPAVEAPAGGGVLLHARLQPGVEAGQLVGLVAPAADPGPAPRRFLPEATLFRLRARGLARGAGAKDLAALERLGRWQELELAGEAERFAAARRLLASGLVDRVEFPRPHQVHALPDDSSIGSQWWLEPSGLPAAWDQVRGEDGEVLVGIVDTGTDWRHEDLVGNAWLNPGEVAGNGIDDDGNGFVDDTRGWNFPARHGDPTGLPQTPGSARHGTHVAGIVAARSDNATGIAGAGWNLRFLPVNVAHPELDLTVAHGYQGLLYAAAQGATVLNASWGRTGRYSDLERDALAALEAAGVVVVAAAGNRQLVDIPEYPAAYPTVFSVASLDEGDAVSFFSNRGHWIDVAAPGRRLYSTDHGGGYVLLSGSSQATALASGIVGLLRTARPGLSPVAVRERLRWTTDPVEDANPGLEVTTGSGRLRLDRALVAPPPPAPAIESVSLQDEDGDGVLERSELGRLELVLFNHGSELFSARVHQRALGPELLVLEPSTRISRLGAGQRLGGVGGLRLFAASNSPLGQLVPLVLSIEAGGRRLHSSWPIEIMPLHLPVRAPGLELSISPLGRLGYSEPLRTGAPSGLGIRRPGGPPLMLGGSFLVGDASGHVADALVVPSEGAPFVDFRTVQGQEYVQPQPSRGAGELRTVFREDQLGLRITWSAIHFDDERWGDFVLLEYRMGSAPSDLVGLRAGLLVDWELSGWSGEQDQLQLDVARGMLWASSALPRGGVAGAVLLEAPGGLSASWLHDLRPAEPVAPWLYDAGDLDHRPTDAVLQELLAGAPAVGPGPTPAGGVAGVLAAGPFDLAAGEEGRVVFAIVAADDAAGLARAADESRRAWSALQFGRDRPPGRAAVWAPFPNPANPRATVRFELPTASRTELVLVDARGRRVRRLLDEPRDGGYHSVEFDGLDDAGRPLASGTYRVVLRALGATHSRPLTLVR